MQPALQLALLIAIILPAVKIAASICGRFAIPPILGELLVGVLLGPGIVDLLHLDIFGGGQATGAVMLLAQLGGYLLMFLAGVETDIERMRKASAGVIVPFVLGAGVGHLFGLSWTTACFLGGALTATSVSISARTLMDAGKMSSPEASVILGAAVIDDVMGLFVLAALAASVVSAKGEAFGVAGMASTWLRSQTSLAADHPLLVQMIVIGACVTAFFVIGYAAAKRWLDPMMRQLRKLDAA